MNKKELKDIIKSDKDLYCKKNILHTIYYKITDNKQYGYMKTIIMARKYKYYKEQKHNIMTCILRAWYTKKLNRLSKKNGIEIYGNFGKNLRIFHSDVVINNKAVLGNNIKLHGMNCIGNNGKDEAAPTIGDNVDIGVGAIIIGNIRIANNVRIGAGCVCAIDIPDNCTVVLQAPRVIMRNDS